LLDDAPAICTAEIRIWLAATASVPLSAASDDVATPVDNEEVSLDEAVPASGTGVIGGSVERKFATIEVFALIANEHIVCP
jgi:hypothetical protein